MTKTQILYVHGGTTFSSEEKYLNWLHTRTVKLEPKIKWNDEFLTEALGNDFQIIRPRFPRKENAKYHEWKIDFEKYLALMDEQIVLIGTSLGGIFLSKYLSENKVDKTILATYIIAPPHDSELKAEELAGGFELGKDLSLLEKQSQKLHYFFSKDDPIIPIEHAQKYKAKLPNAQFHIYDNKNGHFFIPEFPEIVEIIKEDIKK